MAGAISFRRSFPFKVVTTKKLTFPRTNSDRIIAFISLPPVYLRAAPFAMSINQISTLISSSRVREIA